MDKFVMAQRSTFSADEMAKLTAAKAIIAELIFDAFGKNGTERGMIKLGDFTIVSSIMLEGMMGMVEAVYADPKLGPEVEAMLRKKIAKKIAENTASKGRFDA